MPTLTMDDGAVPSPPAPGTKPPGATKPKPKTNAKKKRAPANGGPSGPASPSFSGVRAPPAPPPAASEIQLKMWHAVLLRRNRQIRRLTNPRRLSFANDIISDLLRSRYETNEFSKDLKGGDKNGQGGLDLISGHYKSFLLIETPPKTDLTSEEIGLHLLALFYRSTDNRLPNAMRKHAIDALRRACQKLELWTEREAGKEDMNDSDKLEPSEGSVGSRKRTRKSMEGQIGNLENESRAENVSNRSNGGEYRTKKKMRTPPELNGRISQSLPPQSKGDGVDKIGDKEGGRSKQGKHKHLPRPGPRQRPDGDSMEKEKAGDRFAHSTSLLRTNGNDAALAQKGSTNKEHVDNQYKSRRGQRKDPDQQPKPSSMNIPKESGSRQLLGKRFSSPQKGLSEIEQDQRRVSSSTSALQIMNSEKGASRQESATAPLNMQQKHTTQPNPNKGSAPQLSKSKQGTDAAFKTTTPSSQASKIYLRQAPIPSNKNKDDDNSSRLAKLSNLPQRDPPPSKANEKETGSESDDDAVIDLTSDSPTNESPASLKPPSVQADVSSSSRQCIKSSDDASAGSGRSVHQGSPTPPSPPASPLPPVYQGPSRRAPQPKPKPFSQRRTLIFDADGKPPNSIASGSLNRRTSSVVSFDAGFHLDGSGCCLDHELCIDVHERLSAWDPYWKIVEELGIHEVLADPSQRISKMTQVGTRTTPCVPANHDSHPEFPSSCASVYVNLPKEVAQSKLSNRDLSAPWGVRWGKLSHPYKDERGRERDRLETGDRRLIVRTLPLQRSSKDVKKRADGHLWPKGSFLQLKQGVQGHILSIVQRKQQSHAISEWKGISQPLDLTVKIKTTNDPFELKLCSKEIVENSANYVDALNGTLMGSYALHVAICEYVAPDDLYDRLMGKVPGENVTIPSISLRSARKRAKEYLADQTVLIDDFDDNEKNSQGDELNKVEDRESLTFSLLCPISKTAMQTPVRGRHCKHMGCMDLRNFLHNNKNVTGGRWRCGACEDFVSVGDLVHCGLFQAMLEDLGSQVSGARDKVKLYSDGSWKLMDENRLRYNKRCGNISIASNAVSKSTGARGQKSSSEPEVIELIE